jgi:hypothetical protein
MTLAWYGHLKLKGYSVASKWGVFTIIVLSWGMAFFEYCFQVPANKFGYIGNGGPFSLVQLKIIQEVLSLLIFTIFILFSFKNESFTTNHLISFLFLIGAVYFAFRK